MAVATQDGAVHLWRFEVRQGAEQPMQRRTLVHLNAFHLPGEGGIQDHGKVAPPRLPNPILLASLSFSHSLSRENRFLRLAPI